MVAVSDEPSPKTDSEIGWILMPVLLNLQQVLELVVHSFLNRPTPEQFRAAGASGWPYCV